MLYQVREGDAKPCSCPCRDCGSDWIGPAIPPPIAPAPSSGLLAGNIVALYKPDVATLPMTEPRLSTASL